MIACISRTAIAYAFMQYDFTYDTNRWAGTMVTDSCYLNIDDVIDLSHHPVIEFERNELYLPRIDGQRWGHIFVCTVVKSSTILRVKIKVSYNLNFNWNT